MTHRGPFQPLPFCDSVILSVEGMVMHRTTSTIYCQLHQTILCINWSNTLEVCPIFAPLPPAPDCCSSDGRNLLIPWLN